MDSKKELSKKIKELRIKLIQISEENGINHPLTIQASQELDKLINKYMNTKK